MLDRVKIENILQHCDKSELISLVKRMLDRYPDLEYLLLMVSKEETLVNPQVHRRRVDMVFRGVRDDWEDITDVTGGLWEIVETGDTFAEKQDYANASAVYDAVISGLIEQYDVYSEGDEDGELSEIVTECVDGLRRCLEAVKENEALRTQILRTLFTMYCYELEAGGIGFGEDAPDVMIENSTTDERLMIVGWVYHAIAEMKQKKPHVTYQSHYYNSFSFDEEVSSTGNYGLQSLGNFLLDLQEETLDNEASVRICLETSRVYDAVERLLKLGRVDEAVGATKQADDYELMRIADLFVESGQEAEAARFMRQRVWKSRNTRLLEWVEKHAKSEHDSEDAFNEARAQFQEYSTFEAYKAIRLLATQSGHWEKTRPELLAVLKAKRLHEVLVQVAFDEDDTDEMMKVIQAVGSPVSSSTSSNILALVEAAEEREPEGALHFYQRYAAYLIGGRNRPAYEQATRVLLRIRTLYEKLGMNENWTRYLMKLREQSKTLKVFRDILSAAGL